MGAVCVGENKRKEGWQFVPKIFTKQLRLLLKYAKEEDSSNKPISKEKLSPPQIFLY